MKTRLNRYLGTVAICAVVGVALAPALAQSLGGPISLLPSASLPLAGTEPVACVQNGSTKKCPSASLGVPIAGSVAPTPLAVGQLWLDESTSPWTLRQYDGTSWAALTTVDPVGHTGVAQLAVGGTGQASAQAARSSLGLNIESTYTIGDGCGSTPFPNTARVVITSVTLGAPRTCMLPLADSVNPGTVLWVLDTFGAINGTNTLNLIAQGSDHIAGAPSVQLTTQYAATPVASDGVSTWAAVNGGPMAYVSAPTQSGALVAGNLPKATGPASLTDSGISATHVATDTNTLTLQNKAISGAQNTLSNVPDSALSTNVDLLNGAQTLTGLKTFNGGLALPSTTNPTGSCCYVDSSGNFHFVSAFQDVQFCGGKFAGDASRCWLPAFGSGLTETTSGQQPNFQINRNDKFNNGSGLQFGERILYTQGNGISAPTTAAFASGVSTITVTPNGNFATGEAVYGACIPASTTISSYSSGAMGLSNPLGCNIDQGTEISACVSSSSCSPTNQPIGLEAEIDQYTNQTSSVAAPNALEGYLFKWVPSTSISEGANILCHDYTGRKSSIAGPCIAAEIDTVASGPDDNLDRYIFELTGAESAPSIDGATDIFAGIRIRPQSAESQSSPNPATFDNGVLVTTMPGGAANGVYGSFIHGYRCDGGETTGCFDTISGTLTHATSALASSGQNKLQFALPTSVNVGQVVSGSSHIPAGASVSAVYQCDAVNPVAGCAGDTNVTDVFLSANLTGSVTSSTVLTFTGSLNDGSNFNAWFTDAFANWTNQNGTGWLKAGTTGNTGTVFDILGQGEDSTNTTGVDYGDLAWVIDTNTHGSTLGHIGVLNAGFTVGAPTGGNEGVGTINAQAIYINGAAVGSGGGTVNTTGSPASGNLAKFSGSTSITNGDLSGDATTSGTLAVTVTKTNGVAFGTFATQSFATPPAIGGTTPNAASFTTLSASSMVSGNGFSNYLASPPAIGGTAANAGSFTTLAASGAVSGVGFSNYLASPPAIGGTAAAAGSFTTLLASNDLTTDRHVVSNATAQSCSNVVFGTAAGTSPACNSVTGDDHRFNILFTTGTSPGTSAPVFTLTFNNSYGSAPQCVFAAVGGNTATGLTKFYVTSTTTTVVLNDTSSALSASTAYNLNVQCTG